MRKQRGFSLVELLIATTVISILTLVMMNFVANRILDNAVKNARSDIQLQTQQTLDTISKDIKYAGNVDDHNRWADSHAPGSPGNDFSWTSDSHTLILAAPVQDTSGNIVYQDHPGYVSYKDNLIYFLSNGSLYKRTLAAQVSGNSKNTTCPASVSNCPHDDPLLANNVTSFSIGYFDANDNPVAASAARSIDVTIQVNKRVFTKNLSANYTVRTVLRNQ